MTVMKRLILIPLFFLWAQAAVAASPTIVDGHDVANAIAQSSLSPCSARQVKSRTRNGSQALPANLR